MRKFQYCCTDNITGYAMILSECTYNQACDWLSRELAKWDREIYRTEIDADGMAHIFTGRYIVEDQKYINRRMFYYDEQRGYLLGE